MFVLKLLFEVLIEHTRSRIKLLKISSNYLSKIFLEKLSLSSQKVSFATNENLS